MKIAVWGLGKHAIKNILPALKLLDHIELYGVFSRDASISKKYSEDFGCKTWNSYEEMLKEKDLDVIYVSTPPGIHANMGNKILGANKHFWCEKPFTTNYEDTKSIIKLADSKNLTVAEGFMYFHHPHYQWLKNYLSECKQEEIKLINATFTIPFTDSPGFRYNPALGGSSLLDIGIYLFSLALDLFEGKKIEIVSKKTFPNRKYDIDINGYTNLLIDKKTICNFYWGMGLGYRNEIDILMSNGSIYTDKIFSKDPDYIPIIKLRNQTGITERIELQANNHFVSMFEYFLSLVESTESANLEKKKIQYLASFLEKIKF